MTVLCEDHHQAIIGIEQRYAQNIEFLGMRSLTDQCANQMYQITMELKFSSQI